MLPTMPMVRSRVLLTVLAGLVLASCGRAPEQRAAWRDEAEQRCVREGRVQPSPRIRIQPPIQPNGVCGMAIPHRVEQFTRSGVNVSTPVSMTCPMVAAMDEWLTTTVQPAAVQHFGTAVTAVETAGTYNCRRILHRSYGAWSEHAFGNAMDVTAFVLADGRRVRVGRTEVRTPSPWFWQNEGIVGVSRSAIYDVVQIGPGEDAAAPPDITFGGDAKPFWRQVRNGACGVFSTTLGPGSEDGAHEEHIHVDLARHSRGRRICR